MRQSKRWFGYIVLLALIESCFAQDFQLKDSSTTWYTFEALEYVISNESGKSPEIFHITIEDSIGNVVINEFVYVENNFFEGSVPIPSKTRTGIYVIRCRIPDKESDVYKDRLHIINLQTYSNEDFTFGEARNGKNREPKLFNPVIIEGVVIKNNQPIKSRPLIVMQSRGETELFEYSFANENGFFKFEAPIFGLSQLYFVAPENVSYQLELTGLSYMSNEPVDFLPFRQSEEKIPIDSLKKNLIRSNYEKVEASTTSVDFDLFKFDRNISVSDYQKMPDTYTFFKEAVSFKSLRKKGGVPNLRLLNFENSLLFKGQPLFIVDGFIVKDLNEILTLELEKIESIKTAHKTSRNAGLLGRYSRNGLVFVTTTSKDYVPNEGLFVEVKGLVGVRSKGASYESSLSNTAQTNNENYKKMLDELERLDEKVLLEFTRGEVRLLLDWIIQNRSTYPDIDNKFLSRITQLLEGILNQ